MSSNNNQILISCTLQNIQALKYTSTAGFLADIKWLLHNSMAYYGSMQLHVFELIFCTRDANGPRLLPVFARKNNDLRIIRFSSY